MIKKRVGTLFVLMLLPFFCFSQEELLSTKDSLTISDDTNIEELNENDLSSKKRYKIKSLSISGVENYTPKQILLFTGLKIGQVVEIPGGNAISNAIKKLWRTHRFSEVDFYVESYEGNEVNLKVDLLGLPELNEFEGEGISKSKLEGFLEEVGLVDIEKEKKFRLSNNLQSQLRTKIVKHFYEKGFLDAKVGFTQTPIEDANLVNLKVKVEKGPRVKIRKINFYGNKEISSKKLKSKKVFTNTKRKNRLILGLLKSSKYFDEKFKEDLKRVDEVYKRKGFIDASIIDAKVTRVDKKNLELDIYIEEGNRYYLGDIEFQGNSVYKTELLREIISYKKGDPYDAIGINRRIQGSEKDDDIQTLYLDNGYLFASINAVEKSVEGDTINLQIRITEGLPARINNVTFSGNLQTNDHVIVRYLETRPGDLFSKSDLKNSFFSLSQSGLFDQKGINYDIKPNQEDNSVDIDWKLKESGSSQIELQGGYGNRRFIGTLGLTFNNFSLKGLFDKDSWRPIPMGDGQKLSLRAQAGANFQNFSFSFVQPWLAGRKAQSLSTSIYNSRFNQTANSNGRSVLNIWGGSVGLSRRLNKPDNFFRLSNTISFQNYGFDNYPLNVGTISFNDGFSNNLNYGISLDRTSAGPDPIFPTSGSNFSVGVKSTLPYSMFNNIDYNTISVQERVEWLEFYKFKFSGEWYQQIIGKLVLKTNSQFGYLGAYNRDRGISPFERFFVGGTGLVGNRFDGREIIPLRGYQDPSSAGGVGSRDVTPQGGGTVYNKFQLELRYPLVTGGTKVWALTFAEGANTWLLHNDFSPFELKRSAGFGIRIFMPAFGLLGFDFGYGFDNPVFDNQPSGWQTHFVLGQQL